MYIEYLDEMILLNEKKENFFCASNSLFRKIKILEENFDDDSLFVNVDNQPIEESFFNNLEIFSYKSSVIGKKEKKYYILVCYKKNKNQ